MRPNPGGMIKGEAIVDREKEIASIWRALQNQSVVISSERRVGKTSILRDDYWEESDIINEVKSHLQIDAEPVKEALDLIWSDHYLVREIKDNRRTYKFRYAILQKWWKVNRG